MYRSVVVPLDGSAASEHVLPVAVQIARYSGAALHLVSVPAPADACALHGGTPLDVALPARDSIWAQAYLEQIRERLARGSNLTITTDVLHEPNDHTSASRVAVSDIDLVVLAAYGHSGLARFRLSDITDALARWRPAPILALRAGGAAQDREPLPRLQRILLPLDGSALAEQILAPAVALGNVMGAEYMLLYVVEPHSFVSGAPVPYTSRLDDVALAHAQAEAQDYLDGIVRLMRHEGLRVQTRVAVARDARTAIRQAARQLETDVIAMTTHGRGGLSPLLVGSVAMQVLHDSHVPVLLYRPPERRRRAGRAYRVQHLMNVDESRKQLSARLVRRYK
jgi:nucleotide-binding universal stress UspA family protein